MTRAAEDGSPLHGTLRPLGTGDGETLAALHAALFADGWSAHDFRRFLGDPAVFGFGAGHPALTGFILCRMAVDEAEVLTFGVARPARRRGVGRRLLSAALSEAARRSAAHMFLEVAEDNDAARKLYESAGFVRAGRRPAYYHDATPELVAGGAALVLRCDLCDAGPWMEARETGRARPSR